MSYVGSKSVPGGRYVRRFQVQDDSRRVIDLEVVQVSKAEERRRERGIARELSGNALDVRVGLRGVLMTTRELLPGRGCAVVDLDLQMPTVPCQLPTSMTKAATRSRANATTANSAIIGPLSSLSRTPERSACLPVTPPLLNRSASTRGAWSTWLHLRTSSMPRKPRKRRGPAVDLALVTTRTASPRSGVVAALPPGSRPHAVNLGELARSRGVSSLDEVRLKRAASKHRRQLSCQDILASGSPQAYRRPRSRGASCRSSS